MNFINKLLTTTLIIPLFLSCSRSSQIALKEVENTLKLDKFINAIKKGEIDSRKLDILNTVLSNTSEWAIHQLHGASENKTMIHQDGQQEVVYDGAGKLVKDGMNDGSYNFYHPQKQPLKHFLFDIHPWISWGTSRNDPSTPKERIQAYTLDLANGIYATLQTKKIIEKPKNSSWDSKGQIQTLAIFLKVITEGEAEKLYDLFNSKNFNSPDPDAIKAIIPRLEKGFIKVYFESA